MQEKVVCPHCKGSGKITDSGSWLKSKRHSFRLTQQNVADAIGTSRGVIMQWESNWRKMSPDSVRKAKEFFAALAR